ncbi:hypothetical protein L2D14_01520 [Thalassospiraceae bacterium LMO-JJ14]|nr:hypothetical protein L2D14_01520 [Thalassospiraceae bacterium LMO-JJ14]
MDDLSSSPLVVRMKTSAIIAVLLTILGLIFLLPIEKPFFLADDSAIRADRLLAEGKCKEGYAIYEKRAADGRYDVSWQTVGRLKYRGACGGQDLPGAIAAYRQAAREGACGANFRLAGIALLHPDVPGVTQVSPANNLFASTMCAFNTSDDKIVPLFFESRSLPPAFEQLKPLFLEALERRRNFKTLAADEKKRIVTALVNGHGYDANPKTDR